MIVTCDRTVTKDWQSSSQFAELVTKFCPVSYDRDCTRDCMGKNDVLIKLPYTNIKYVYVKKRKTGCEINEAVVEAVRKKQ